MRKKVYFLFYRYWGDPEILTRLFSCRKSMNRFINRNIDYIIVICYKKQLDLWEANDVNRII